MPYAARMSWTDRFAFFSATDLGALVLLTLAWLGIGFWIENSGEHRPSVSKIMARYRMAWMHQMVTRQPRIFDSQVLGNLRQSAAFFASASMIAIGGGLALLGNAEKLLGVANDLTLENDPLIVWEIKVLVIILFLSNGFLKFVWSLRLFGYCAVLMAAVPNDVDDPAAYPLAAQAGRINITAARSFNRGLRSVYFALCSLAWIMGPEALIGATVFTFVVLWRREFASESRGVLLQNSEV